MFLPELFEEKPEGKILIWLSKTKQSYWFDDPEEAEGFALEQEGDVYFGLGISPQDYGLHKRCKAEDVVGVTCLWMDVDYVTGSHQKKNLPPAPTEAREIVFQEPYPTYLVSTGGGFHAYWLLDSFYDQEELGDFVKKWQDLIRLRSGYDLDATHDFSRVLRVPGTRNTKYDCEVKIAIRNDAKYSLDDLKKYVLNQKVVMLRANSDEFERIWTHRMRGGDQSQSGYDMRIANLLKQAKFEVEEIKELIYLNRMEYSPGKQKGNMQDYLSRTLSKVFSDVSVKKAVPDELPEGEQIVKVQKTNSEEPAYYFVYADGSKLKLNSAEDVLSFRRYAKIYFVARDRIPPKMKQSEWDDLVNEIMENVEIIDTGDESTTVGLISSLLSQYVRAIGRVEIDESNSHSVLQDTEGGLWLVGKHFKAWLKDVHGITFNNSQYGAMLRELGFEARMLRSPDGERFQIWGPYNE